MSAATTTTPIYGTDGPDTLDGTSNSDQIFGLGGNDKLYGHEGRDELSGGPGDDFLDGGTGGDLLNGDAGNDYVVSTSGDDVVDGGEGSDYLVLGSSRALYTLGTSSNGDHTLTHAVTGAVVAFKNVEYFYFTEGWISLESLLAKGPTESNDILTGDDGPNAINGLGGNDYISGLAGDDNLRGGEGNDHIDGGAGNDVLDGGAGSDTLDYYSAPGGVDVNLATGRATGAAGNDTIANFEVVIGTDFDDHIVGDGGDNTIQAGDGNNRVEAGAGNDSISAGVGDDVIDGGAGIDRVQFTGWHGALHVDLAAGTADGAGHDILIGIENVVGSSYDDVLTGDANDNILSPGKGNDKIDGGLGRDTLDLGSWANSGSAGYRVDLREGVATSDSTHDDFRSIENVIGTTYADVIIGDTQDNVLDGSSGNDSLDGGAGNDQLIGGDGDDNLMGRAGDDQLLGGKGNDTLYADDAWGVAHKTADGGDSTDTLILDAAKANYSVVVGESGGQTITNLTTGYTISTQNIEWVQFSDNKVQMSDWAVKPIIATEGDDVLVGGSDDDTIDGLGGRDIIHGNGGNDHLYGGAGQDYLYGGAGDDVIDGGADWDMVSGGPGNDVLNGGADGASAVDYSSAPGPVAVNLTTGQASGADGNDTLENFSTIYGSAFSDQLVAGDYWGSLYGGDGDDSLVGTDAGGWFEPGRGDDVVRGGASTYDYLNFQNASAGVNVDLSTGVATGEGTDTISGIETVFGTRFDDRLIGDEKSNTFYPFAGHNTVDGGAGIDALYFYQSSESIGAIVNVAEGRATSGDSSIDFRNVEVLNGSSGPDIFYGDATDNVLDGAGGDDVIHGGGGNDTLFGGKGNDSLFGDAGDDLLDASFGNSTVDTVDGGGGVDSLLLSGYATQWTRAQEGSGGWVFSSSDQVVHATNIEFVKFSDGTISVDELLNMPTNGDDVLNGNDNDNVIDGLAGNDTIDGRGGNDTLTGGPGIDRLIGGTGDDHFILDRPEDIVEESTDSSGGRDVVELRFGSSATYTLPVGVENAYAADGSGVTYSIIGNSLNNNLSGGKGNNNYNLSGGDGDDYLTGGWSGVDILDGGAGNDVIAAYGGNDHILGGAGVDQMLIKSGAGMSVNLATGVTSGDAGVGTISGVENVLGGTGNDTIVGDAASNDLAGGSGDDDISGSDGDDSITGGEGNDIERGGSGNDVLYTGVGADTLDGGAGTDLAHFGGAQSGVAVDLMSGTASRVYPGEFVTLVNIENVSGSRFDDRIYGSNENNVIDGFGGSDNLFGNGGDDVFICADDQLIGGKGATGGYDVVDGGSGIDTVMLASVRSNYTVNLFANGQVEFKNKLTGGTVVATDIELIKFSDGVVPLSEFTTPHPTEGDDVLNGSADSDVIDGLGGNDIINGLDGHDNLLGSSGNDTLNGGNGSDTLTGGSGDDALNGGSGDDLLIADSGNDVVDGGDGADTLVLAGTAAQWALSWVGGIQRFSFGGRTVSVSNVESVRFDDGTHTISELFQIATSGDDVLHGDEGNNSINGLEGNDTIDGRGGDDYLIGGPGVDRLIGGTGNDTLLLDRPDDQVVEAADASGGSNDTVVLDFGVAGGNYQMPAGVEAVMFIEPLRLGQQPHYVVTGNELNNVFSVPTLLNTIGVQAASFDFFGGSGADILNGGPGNNVLDGGEGDDTINLAGGTSTVRGGSGTDLLTVAAARSQWDETFDNFGFIVTPGNDVPTVVDLSAGVLSGVVKGSVSGIENVRGSGLVDWLTGDAGKNPIGRRCRQ